jgi:hypothetical protein
MLPLYVALESPEVCAFLWGGMPLALQRHGSFGRMPVQSPRHGTLSNSQFNRALCGHADGVHACASAFGGQAWYPRI